MELKVKDKDEKNIKKLIRKRQKTRRAYELILNT